MKKLSYRLPRPSHRRQGLLHRLHARMHRLPAHLTREDDWSQDTPGIKLSRVFGIVLGIHIVAIGGLMAYEMFRHKDPAGPAAAALKPASREARGMAAGLPVATAPDNPAAVDPANEGLKTHVVAPGEKLSDIASLYQVDERAVVAKNRIGAGHPLESGMKLVIPNRLMVPAVPPDPRKLLGAAATGPKAPAVSEPPVPTAPAAPADGTVAGADKPVRRALPVVENETKSSADRDASQKAPPKMVPTRQAAVAAKKPAPSKVEPVVAKARGKVHIVKDGENAYRIARAYGVNVDQLIRANGIKPDKLRPGTSLVIPSSR